MRNSPTLSRGLAVLGVLVLGTLLATSLPAGAGDDPVRKLQRRVQQLEGKVQSLTSELGTLKAAVASLQTRVSGTESGLSSLKTRMSGAEGNIDGLESKTSKMDSSGNYEGDVDGWQVSPPGGYGCYDKPAHWGSSALIC